MKRENGDWHQTKMLMSGDFYKVSAFRMVRTGSKKAKRAKKAKRPVFLPYCLFCPFCFFCFHHAFGTETYPMTITDTLRSRESSSSTRKILCQRPSWSNPSATLTQAEIGRKRALQCEWPLAGSSGGMSTRRLKSLCSYSAERGARRSSISFK